MLAAALRAEVAAYIDRFADQVDENGRRLVVRNGYHAERQAMTAAGAVTVAAPRVNDKRADPETGERQRFSSAILPAWCCRSPQVSEVLPLLYLHGLSTGDFGAALEQFLGSGAGLSAASITRLTASWQDEAKAFASRDLSGTDYVYLWVDGIHTKVRLEQEKLCLLVMLGVRADGRKELVAISDGYRESTESWADLLRDCRRRGMTAPVLAVGDGALGFWRALRDVFPQTREQRCWFHRSRKESTCRCVADFFRGEEFGGGVVAGCCRCGVVAIVFEQWSCFADDAADQGAADVAEGVGENVEGAQFSEVEHGQQDAFGVADLLWEHPAAGAVLAWPAAAVVGETFGLGCLAAGESLGEFCQFGVAHPGQCWCR